MPTEERLLPCAKRMRSRPTDAEAWLWRHLRAGHLQGFKFKRQQPMHNYIVDFICPASRLIIEADGSQHADNRDDARRDAFLRSQRFRVLRFWNNDILARSGEIADAIYIAVASPHPPTGFAGGSLPLPQGERGLEL